MSPLRFLGPAGTPTSGGSTGGGGGGAGLGAGSYEHVQATPARVWRFTHDLPFTPAAHRIHDDDAPGAQWHVAVDVDERTRAVVVTFPIAVRGRIVLS